MAELEETRRCIHCETSYQIVYNIIFGRPDLCPFCGAESEIVVDDEEDVEYDEQSN